MYIRNENCRCGIDSEWGMSGSMNEWSENAITFNIIYLPIFSFFVILPIVSCSGHQKLFEGFLSVVSELNKSINICPFYIYLKNR